MATLQELLVVLMMALPTHYLDTETPDERQQRMGVIAAAIVTASDYALCHGKFAGDENCEAIWTGTQDELVVLLLTKAFWESRLAQNVHAGKCRDWQCDPWKSKNGTIVHRARTIWQLQRTRIVTAEWDWMLGTDRRSTTYAAWAATKVLSRGKRACSTTNGTIRWYATGRCDSNVWVAPARKRTIFFEQQLRKLRALRSRSVDAPRHAYLDGSPAP